MSYMNVLSNQWSIKINGKSDVKQFKACLVANGQCPRFDYNETFSSIVKLNRCY